MHKVLGSRLSTCVAGIVVSRAAFHSQCERKEKCFKDPTQNMLKVNQGHN
jgi:hypothetical protein